MIKEQLQKDTFIISEVKGDSMLPFLHGNVDKVVISKDKRINKYDVILYKNKDNRNILHRVVGIKDNMYCVRGDNSTANELVNSNEVLGVLVGYYNSNGYVEINDSLNKKYYLLSLPKYCLRRIKETIA